MGPPPRARGRHATVEATHDPLGTTPAGAGTTFVRDESSEQMQDHPRGRGDDWWHVLLRLPGAGPPPRARGRQRRAGVVRAVRGTTPAGAGTTAPPPPAARRRRDHPRGRGDDVAQLGDPGGEQGPPPRARGRPDPRSRAAGRRGTTPAGAGTTTRAPRTVGRGWDHPRGRGDDVASRCTASTLPGPPPRARGRRSASRGGGCHTGTTPAGAGTTPRPAARRRPARDHPRGRGDDSLSSGHSPAPEGPPPRARGRRTATAGSCPGVGTTPAGAGTTRVSSTGSKPAWDHPRGRGDDPGRRVADCGPEGPPPRARGRPAGPARPGPDRGTTPAGAGTTTLRPARRTTTGDHPRGRGDDPLRVGRRAGGEGPPPRARGRRMQDRNGDRRSGTTPAGAGTTRRRAGRERGAGDHPRGRGDDGFTAREKQVTAGPPPRARGRQPHPVAARTSVGTTPAGAGTTR